MEGGFAEESCGENGEKKGKKTPEENFLHAINVDDVLRETGLDIKGLCSLLNVGSQSISRWSESKEDAGNRPKYNSIIRLLLKGATVKTLFGVDYDALHTQAQANSASEPDNTPIDYSDPKFQEGFDKTLAVMKARGMIKDEVAKTIAEMKANGEL